MRAAAYWAIMWGLSSVLAFGLDMRGVQSWWADMLAGMCLGVCACFVYFNAPAGLVTAATAPARLFKMIVAAPVLLGPRLTIGLITLIGVIVWALN